MGGYSKFRVVMWREGEGRNRARFVSGHRTKEGAEKAKTETLRNLRPGEWVVEVEPVAPGDRE